jgi:hypothetical protein
MCPACIAAATWLAAGAASTGAVAALVIARPRVEPEAAQELDITPTRSEADE